MVFTPQSIYAHPSCGKQLWAGLDSAKGAKLAASANASNLGFRCAGLLDLQGQHIQGAIDQSPVSVAGQRQAHVPISTAPKFLPTRNVKKELDPGRPNVITTTLA